VEALKARGRPEDAAALVVNYLENGSKAFPYWIGEAAQLLRRHRPSRRGGFRASTPDGRLLHDDARGPAAQGRGALTENPDIREEMIRETIATTAPASNMIRIAMRSSNRTPTLADALRPLAPRARSRRHATTRSAPPRDKLSASSKTATRSPHGCSRHSRRTRVPNARIC
jgi:hypothetical protein